MAARSESEIDIDKVSETEREIYLVAAINNMWLNHILWPT